MLTFGLVDATRFQGEALALLLPPQQGVTAWELHGGGGRINGEWPPSELVAAPVSLQLQAKLEDRFALVESVKQLRTLRSAQEL